MKVGERLNAANRHKILDINVLCHCKFKIQSTKFQTNHNAQIFQLIFNQEKRMKLERTLVFLKPDAFKRSIAGEIISRFERRGFLIAGMKLIKISEEFARRHYAAHKGKDFYEPLINYVISGPSLVIVLEGKNAVSVVREMMGETFGCDSAPGTIRGDYALSNRYNLIHGSDSLKAAEQEINRFFKPEELVSYGKDDVEWIYDVTGSDIV